MTRLVDLSMKMDDGFSLYPGAPKLAITNRITHAWSAGRYSPPAYSATDRIMMLNEHIGTHVDAPYHFLADGASLETFPLERFWGRAVLADVSDRDPSVPVGIESILGALDRNGESIREDDILVLRCWAGDVSDPGYLRASALEPEVGTWAAGLRLKALGIDLANVDNPGDRSFPVHIALLQAGVLIYESLVNLGDIRRARFQFIGFPLPICGASGGAVRAVALVD
jgi:kynurenine formamidase